MARGTTVVLFFLVVVSTVSFSSGKERALGELEWCETVCLCHRTTKEQMHCFEPVEIYGLLQIDKRKVDGLLRSNFDIAGKLTWCKEDCLCYKVTKKEFRCTDKENLKVIAEIAPHLEKYLNPYTSDIVELERIPPTETPVLPEEKKPKKGRKNGKKNKKNKNKKRKEEERMLSIEEETVQPPPEPETMVLSAGIYPNEAKLKSLIEGKIDDVESLTDQITMLLSRVMVNRYLSLVAIGLVILLIMGMVMYCCFKCCGQCCQKKASKDISTKSKKSPKDSDEMKVNMNDGW